MTRPAILAVAILASVAFASPVFSANVSPVGKWQTKTGESRFEVSYCGGGKLCARLTWLRADARTPENLPYLNKYVVKGARPAGDNRWRGLVSYAGEKLDGQMTLVDDERMVLSGCKMIFCQTVEFNRI